MKFVSKILHRVSYEFFEKYREINLKGTGDQSDDGSSRNNTMNSDNVKSVLWPPFSERTQYNAKVCS